MQLFRIIEEIDYNPYPNGFAVTLDSIPVFGGEGGNLTSVKMFRVYDSGLPQGVESQLFYNFAGNFIQTIDMIVDMGGRPLKLPNGFEAEAKESPREAMMASLDKLLKETGMD